MNTVHWSTKFSQMLFILAFAFSVVLPARADPAALRAGVQADQTTIAKATAMKAQG